MSTTTRTKRLGQQRMRGEFKPFFVIARAAMFYAGHTPIGDGHQLSTWKHHAHEAKRFSDFLEAKREADSLMAIYHAISIIRYSPETPETPDALASSDAANDAECKESTAQN